MVQLEHELSQLWRPTSAARNGGLGTRELHPEIKSIKKTTQTNKNKHGSKNWMIIFALRYTGFNNKTLQKLHNKWRNTEKSKGYEIYPKFQSGLLKQGR